MERVREAVDLARRAAARAPEDATERRRRRRSSNPSQASMAEEAAIDDASTARSRLARLLPDTPTDQLLASLHAASGSSAGELKVRGFGSGRGDERECNAPH